MRRRELSDAIEDVGRHVVDEAYWLHRELGPGLLEGVYSPCLADGLARRGLVVEREVAVGLEYRGRRIDTAFRMDIRVERDVIVEVKSVERTLPVHFAQLLSYLRLTGAPLGYLINFKVASFGNAVTRIVNTGTPPLRDFREFA